MKHTRESLKKLNRSELRRICDEFNIKSARSNAQTIQRILSVMQPVQTINYQPLSNTNSTISNSSESLLDPTEQNKIRSYFYNIFNTVREMRKRELVPYYLIVILLLYYNCGCIHDSHIIHSSISIFDTCEQLYSECTHFVNDFISFDEYGETPSVNYVLDNLGFTTECPNNVETLNNMIQSNRKILGLLFVGIGLLGMLLLQILRQKQSGFRPIND